jgi:hypothetical protein
MAKRALSRAAASFASSLALGAWRHGARGRGRSSAQRSGRAGGRRLERARSFFERAREYVETPEVLDGLSEVARFDRQYERASELNERAFAAYRRAGRGQRRPTSPAGLPSSMPRATETSWSRAAGWVGPRGSWKESRSALPTAGGSWTAVLARPLGAREVRRIGADDREAVRRCRSGVRGACSARRAPPPISTKKNFTAPASPLRSVIAWPTRR